MRFPTRIKDVSFDPADFRVRWYDDGELNVTVSCLDRQLAERGDKTALLFEGDDPGVTKRSRIASSTSRSAASAMRSAGSA